METLASANHDLSTLAWVRDELGKSLDLAHKSLRRYYKEASAPDALDEDITNISALRAAASQIHQGVGALELVGLSEGATLLRASESAVQKLMAKPQKIDLPAIEKIEQASFALLDYISRLLNQKEISPVALFPQFNAIQQLADAERIHPADLWNVSWRWASIPPTSGVQPMAIDSKAVTAFEGALLSFMRAPRPENAQKLQTVCASLGATLGDSSTLILWRLAAGFYEGITHQLIAIDNYSKRAGSALLAWLKSSVRGEQDAPQRLAQDLLFFCVYAHHPDAGQPWPPTLQSIRQSWGFSSVQTVDYSVAKLGQYDPAWVTLASKRVIGAKDAWAAVAGGDLHRIGGLTEQFNLLGESLQKLFAGGEWLARSLQQAVSATVQTATPPSPTLAMEVATSVLYVEASLEDHDFDHPEQRDRIQRLSSRIDAVRQGKDAEPLEQWMEDLYRRVSDRQTLGSVVQELHASLQEIETHIDAYFRAPEDVSSIAQVPQQLQSMRGVLTVLGMDHGAHAVIKMRDDIESLIVPGDSVSTTSAQERSVVVDRLTRNLGALGFLIDMLGFQAHVAKSLFTWDEATGLLNAVMGRSVGAPLLPPEIERLEAEEKAVLESAPDQIEVPEVLQPHQVEPAATQSGPSTISSGMIELDFGSPVTGQPAHIEDLSVDNASKSFNPSQFMLDVKEEVAPVAIPATTPVASVAAAPVTTGLEEDDEMLDIFLEEATEVAETANQALASLAETPDSQDDLTIVRRAFHTLKGSSRMVGLKDFGEAAWACEQLYNTWLADGKPASPELLQLSEQSLAYLSAWVDEFKARQPITHISAPVIAAANALRLEGQWIGVDTTPSAPVDLTVESSPAHDVDVPILGEDAELSVSEPPLDLSLDIAETPASEASWSSTEILPDAPKEAEQVAGDIPSLDLALDLDLLDEVQAVDLDVPLNAEDTVDIGIGDALEHTEESPSLIQTLHPSAPAQTDIDLPLLTEEQDEPDLVLDIEAADPSLDIALDSTLTHDVLPTDSVIAQPVEQQRRVEELGLSEALYDIYLSEAEERSAHLIETLAAWKQDTSVPVPDDAIIYAHSLAGSSATVGYTGLSSLAKLLEDALLRTAHIRQVDEATTQLFCDSAEEVRRLLHQFAAGLLKEPSTELMERLNACVSQNIERLESLSVIGGYEDELEAAEIRSVAEQSMSAVEVPDAHADESVVDLPEMRINSTQEESQSIDTSGATEVVDSTGLDLPEVLSDETLAPTVQDTEVSNVSGKDPEMDTLAAPTEEPVVIEKHAAPAGMLTPPVLGAPLLTPLQAPLVSHRAEGVEDRRQPHISLDDDIDAVDAIDPDLFPIFEEEAQELLPMLSQQMRDLQANPADTSAAFACMRTLHTFKGGARLSGAMRLGEIAHRLESGLERQINSGTTPDDASLQKLQAQVDALSILFEALRTNDPQAYAQAQMEAKDLVEAAQTGRHIAPVQAPVAMPPVSAAEADTRIADNAEVQTTLSKANDQSSEGAESVAPDTKTAALEAQKNTVLEPVSSPRNLAKVDAENVIDWSRFMRHSDQHLREAQNNSAPQRAGSNANSLVRVRSQLLDRMVNTAGEVSITRARLTADMTQIRGSLNDLVDNLDRLRTQLRDMELQAETQMSSRMEAARALSGHFDPLEFDRFTRFQELSRMLAESVNDVATVQRTLTRSVESTEDALAAQARMTRELQEDLLRTRMVEFESLSDRLYRVIRLAAKDSGKQVRLDIIGGQIEIDRSVLERMTGSFEHLLRNSVAHGIELPEDRVKAGKEATGTIIVSVSQEGNEVSVQVQDDGAGLNLPRIRERAVEAGLIHADHETNEAQLAQLIFQPGFTTAQHVTELAGRGVGMDVVRSEINAIGGRIETSTTPGRGTSFNLIMPLTTAVTQVVMVRCGGVSVALPANLVEIVRRSSGEELDTAYTTGAYPYGSDTLPFFWLGALLNSTPRSLEIHQARSQPVVVVRSAQQRVAIHVDEVLGNQEVVVKNLGTQLARLPGLAGMSLLVTGAVALIYNPVALAAVYGESALNYTLTGKHGGDAAIEQDVATGVDTPVAAPVVEARTTVPLILVVDDSLTVRRVTQRFLTREGYRVALAKDGLDALEKLAEETPSVVLSDIEMPRMDGFDLLRNIRSDSRWEKLPVVMITSRIAQKHRDYAVELGANHYLGKPYSEEDLLALVKEYVSLPQAT